MKPQPPPPRHIVVEIAMMKEIEVYLGDRPQRDKRAADLHARIVTLLDAQGLLRGDAG
jgi:hypothetical protein